MVSSSVCALCFPYSEQKHSLTHLSKLILTNDEDTSRILIGMEDGKCANLEHFYTETQQPHESRTKFISGDLDLEPLLLSISPQYHKLKLNLSVSQTLQAVENSLIILKTHGDDTDTETLRNYLKQELYGLALRDVSKISFAKIVTQDGPETVVVNDKFNPQALASKVLNVSLWEQTETDIELLFTFKLWIEPLPRRKSSIKAKLNELPSIDTRGQTPLSLKLADIRKAYNFSLEDGPEFRLVLSKYEQHIPKLKKVMQSLHDEARSTESNIRRIMHSRAKILELLNSLVEMQFNPLLRKLDLSVRMDHQFLLMFDPIDRNLGQFIRKVIDITALPKMLGFFSPVLPHEGSDSSPSRKTFEKNSKDYYEWLNKYLSNEKDRPQLKLLLKRKAFELSKFDYLNTLNGSTNNQYFNLFLENLLKFSRTAINGKGNFDFHSFRDAKASQALLTADDNLYLNSLSRFNSEKLQLRQMIVACRTNEELTNLIKTNPLNPAKSDATDVPQENGDVAIETTNKLDLAFPTNGPSSATISPTYNHPSPDESGQMSGILYALGGKGKPGWHKEWVVLRDGQLMEFSDWRKGRLPINKPVDIALSSIKATTHDKRQFCFEIITSQNQKHVFQAMDNDERDQWMKALYNAGQIMLNLNPLPKVRKAPGKLRTKLDARPPPQILSPNELHRLSSPVSIISSVRIPTTNIDYLDMVRSVSGANNEFCADCGSTDSVEWVSANLLVVVCVKCSSCHRNMGLHISKVRSLRLDHFADESLVLLKYVNNAAANAYLQCTDDHIGPDTSDEERLLFVQKKYQQRAFMEPITELDPRLVQAVRRIDIAEVVKCLNCGADPNLRLQVGTSTQESEPKIVSLFEYSLRKAVVVEEVSTSREYYVVSELILLHGCNLQGLDTKATLKLTDEAQQYWENKKSRVV